MGHQHNYRESGFKFDGPAATHRIHRCDCGDEWYEVTPAGLQRLWLRRLQEEAKRTENEHYILQGGI